MIDSANNGEPNSDGDQNQDGNGAGSPGASKPHDRLKSMREIDNGGQARSILLRPFGAVYQAACDDDVADVVDHRLRHHHL